VLETPQKRLEVLKATHNENGHLGVRNTFENIRRSFWWPGMYPDIKDHISKCEDCNRQARPSQVEESQPVRTEQIFERIQMDLIGPLPVTERGNKYICVAIECLTRWTEAAPLKNATAEEVKNFLYDHIITRFGCPIHLQTDQGTHFKNHIIRELTQKWNITHHFSSSYHPQSNGMVERQNQTISKALARTCQGKDWDLKITQCLLAHRSTKHAVTGFTPAELLYGTNILLPIEARYLTRDARIDEEQALETRRV
jgi:hypothetical protein